MKRILSLFMALLLVLSVPVMAQEDTTADTEEVELTEPSVLPDSNLYGFKRAWERLGNLFYLRAEAKANRRIELAEKRLAEAMAMAERKMDEYVSGLTEEYGENVEEANEVAKLSKEAKLRERLARMVSKATAKHLRALAKAEKRMAKARAKIIAKNIEALRTLARENPEDAAELAMETAEDLAEEAEEVAEEDEEAGEVVKEYEKYANFGKEISEIAQQVGKDPMKVIELVKAARSRHLLVLQRVREKVPEKAKLAIGKAIKRSEEKIENHVKRLEEIKTRVTERNEERKGQADLTTTPTGDLVVTQ